MRTRYGVVGSFRDNFIGDCSNMKTVAIMQP